jgi:hypothetical protein
MQHIVISGKIFLVDAGYLDEPLDTSYPVYDLENDVPVMNVEAATLQKISTPVKGCYAKTFATEIERSLHTAIEQIDIRPILRLMVNNERYIHYVCGPVLIPDLIGREGGQYLSCQLDTDGNVTFFAGNTMLDLLGCERHNIPAVNNGMVKLVKDAYFQEALETLVSMTKANDICQESVTVGVWKDPSKLPVPETDHNHPKHCQWCQSIGLNGKHGNHWANNGIVYDDNQKVQGDGNASTNNNIGQP